MTAGLIFDLTGIQDFTLLQGLGVVSQYLNALDVSNMLYLQELVVTGNYLNCLNVSNCPALYYLFCENNYLTKLIYQTASPVLMLVEKP